MAVKKKTIGLTEEQAIRLFGKQNVYKKVRKKEGAILIGGVGAIISLLVWVVFPGMVGPHEGWFLQIWGKALITFGFFCLLAIVSWLSKDTFVKISGATGQKKEVVRIDESTGNILILDEKGKEIALCASFFSLSDPYAFGKADTQLKETYLYFESGTFLLEKVPMLSLRVGVNYSELFNLKESKKKV